VTEQEKPKTKRGGKREGAGRPSVPESEHMVYMQITLPSTMRDYAKKQEGGASAFIRKLIAYEQHLDEFIERQKLVENSSK